MKLLRDEEFQEALPREHAATMSVGFAHRTIWRENMAREHRSPHGNSPGRLPAPHKTRCGGGAAGVLLGIVLSARGEMI
jgi:hypothetical protein